MEIMCYMSVYKIIIAHRLPFRKDYVDQMEKIPVFRCSEAQNSVWCSICAAKGCRKY